MQMDLHPVAVVITHVHKYEIRMVYCQFVLNSLCCLYKGIVKLTQDIKLNSKYM